MMSYESLVTASDKVEPMDETVPGHFGLSELWSCFYGKTKKFDGWVAAHWDIDLVASCECGRKYNLRSGTMTLKK